MSRLGNERGVALVIVLMAIMVILPPTIILASFAMRWQRQAIDMRDGMEQEYLAEAALEHARNRLSGDDVDIEVEGRRTFRVDELDVEFTLTRLDDVVLTVEGDILEGLAAGRVNLDQVGVDAEGRTVYQYRKLELYLVETVLQRRPSLVPTTLRAVMARLPNGTIETLGVTRGN